VDFVIEKTRRILRDDDEETARGLEGENSSMAKEVADLDCLSAEA
jgi:hypothetical protein